MNSMVQDLSFSARSRVSSWKRLVWGPHGMLADMFEERESWYRRWLRFCLSAVGAESSGKRATSGGGRGRICTDGVADGVGGAFGFDGDPPGDFF